MATRTEIVEALERLETHCRAPLMSIDARTGWMRDWCEDLKDFDIADIHAACAQWRNGDSVKFPLPGQLKAVIRAATRPTTVEKDDRGGLWREITDAEYARLTLSEKIRHHQIMAAEELRRAGPQWKMGQHVAAEDMPNDWHETRRLARNHSTEAKRLLSKMREAKEQAA